MIKPKSVLFAQPWYLLAVAFVLLLVQIGAFGQAENGQIKGTVTDQNGGLVPGATITLKNEKTGETRTATSGSDGTYTVSSLKPSTYTITVTTNGLATKATNVEVLVGQALKLDLVVNPRLSMRSLI